MASVECSICFNEFRDPRVLACGHTFCLQCIEDLTSNADTLKCPQCRQVHPGFTTAAAMPRNVTANDLIEELQRMRLASANAPVGAVASSSTLNDNVANLTICKECGRSRAIDDLIFCTNHNFCVCPKCCQLKHKQCNVVDAAQHACNVLLADKVALENAQCALIISADRLAQDIHHSVARLKQWADVFNKVHELYERTGQHILNRFHDLGKEVSNHKELLHDLLDSQVNAATLLYSGDWTNADDLVATCADYSEVDFLKVAGFAEDNIVRRFRKHDKPTLPALDDELANTNVDELLRQIDDKIDRVQREARTSHNLDCSTAGRLKQSFYVLRKDTNDFSKLSASRSAWTKLASMPKPTRTGFSVAACADKIFVIGGKEISPDDSSIVQQYDTQTGWHFWAPMLKQRNCCGAAALGCRLFAVGGVGLSSVEECDLETGRWAHVAPMTAARSGAGVAAFDNLLFAVGGWNGNSRLNSAECYDPRAGAWARAAPMHEPRNVFGCAGLGDRLYVAGGLGDDLVCISSVEWFDLRAGRWTRVRDMGAPRSQFAFAALNGQLLAAGGLMSGSDKLDTVEVYDEKRDAWSRLDVRLPWTGWSAGCVAEF